MRTERSRDGRPADPGDADGPGDSARREPSGVLARLTAVIERRIVGVFVTPAVLFIVVMMAFPVGYTIWLSFHEWTGGLAAAPRFVGLANFQRLLFDDPRFWGAVSRTFTFTAMAVGVETVLGVAIAVMLNREFRARGLVRTVFLLPMIATPVAVALVWRLMYQPQLGILNDLLTSMGLPPSEWVSDPSLALPALVLVDIWEWTPLITLITLAGLTALPEEPFEAARVDGASGWQVFRFVTLPMVRPVIIVAVVFRLIEALKTFDPILVITQGGPGFATETLNIYVYQTSFHYQRLGYSASLLIVFFFLVLGSSSLLLRFRRASDDR